MKIQQTESVPTEFKPVSVTFTFESQAELDAMTTLMASEAIDAALQEVLAVNDNYVFTHGICDELHNLGGEFFTEAFERALKKIL